MEVYTPRIGLTLLATLVALLAVSGRPAPGQDGAAKPQARTVEGIARTQSGKPLARVTLYLFGLPPGQTDMMTLGDQTTVITDDQGRFTWSVPASLPPLSDYIGVRSIECYALAADRSAERFRLAVRPNWHGTDADMAARSLLEQATRPCKTGWILGGAHPVFSVVVPDTSAVLLAVRGPDRKPLRAREVQVVPVGLPADYMGAVVYTGRTDAGGRLRLRCFPGSLRLQVFVPGLGFGSTGTFVDGANQSAAPLMPPLAPFASLSGTVASALAGPDASVCLDSTVLDENVWYDPRAAVDAGGRWTLADMLPGQHRLVLTGGRGEGEPMWVTVQPGEQVTGIAIGPQKHPSQTEKPAVSLPTSAPSVQGRVVDVVGRPVAGADVYVVCSYSGGSRGEQKVFVAKTDAGGVYRITGLPAGDGRTGLPVHLVAHQPGFGLALGDGQIDGGSAPDMRTDLQKELVFPGTHNSLTVRVLQHGKPAPDVPLVLDALGGRTLVPLIFRESDRGEAAQALRMLLTPSARTGPDGAARFTDLTPGLWDVTANQTPIASLIFEGLRTPHNDSTGVIVRAGEDASYTLSLIPPPGEVTFRLAGPDSMPSTVPASVSLTTAFNPYYGSLTLSREGTGSGQFFAPGLFQVTARVGDRPLDINALAGPYFEGTALVAVSPATAPLAPIIIPARRLGPASIRVRIQDRHGRPLRGAVTITGAFNKAHYAGSVDATGVAVFPDMPQGKYTVAAHLAGRPGRAALDRPDTPLPTDAALAAGTAQPLPQTVVVRSGEETSVTFGLPPPGYVRLRLIGPLAAAQGYYVEGRLPSEDALIDTRFDPATRDYLLGPLPPGRRALRLFRYVPAPVGANLIAGEIAVTVPAGQVVHAALAPQSTAEQEALYSSPLVGTVLLPDGKTPAWGARAALFLPDSLQPARMAGADVQGRLTLNDFWRGEFRSPAVPPGSTTQAVLVAWLPGANGAAIVPYKPGHDQRLVLPAPVTLHGRVTAGGQSVVGLPSSFKVRAAYQGRGVLNQVLTVEATAQADGTFTLGGLTPGGYRVQAARDDVWLSSTQTVTVGTGVVPELTLDIARPGSPIILRLEDRQGKPQSRREIKIARPDGPLTEEIWPATLTSDGTGLLRVDGLESGHHLVTVPGRAGQSAGFDVPAWTPAAPPETPRIALRLAP